MFNTALMMSVWQRLDEWDKWLFIKLNSQWTNPFFDALFPYLRTSVTWVPLYLFILVFMTMNFGRKGLWWSLLFICTVAVTDLVGARILKDGIKRLRPCSDPDFSFHVRLLLHRCSDSYSFVSNHAANHFGIATFAFFTFRGMFRKWMYIAFVWAFFISYAQIYVGLHYPFDVLGGALLGGIAGLLTAWLFDKKWGAFNTQMNYTN